MARRKRNTHQASNPRRSTRNTRSSVNYSELELENDSEVVHIGKKPKKLKAHTTTSTIKKTLDMEIREALSVEAENEISTAVHTNTDNKADVVDLEGSTLLLNLFYEQFVSQNHSLTTIWLHSDAVVVLNDTFVHEESVHEESVDTNNGMDVSNGTVHPESVSVVSNNGMDVSNGTVHPESVSVVSNNGTDVSNGTVHPESVSVDSNIGTDVSNGTVHPESVSVDSNIGKGVSNGTVYPESNNDMVVPTDTIVPTVVIKDTVDLNDTESPCCCCETTVRGINIVNKEITHLKRMITENEQVLPSNSTLVEDEDT